MARLAVSQRHSGSLGGVAGGEAKQRRKEHLTAKKGGVTGLSATCIGVEGPVVHLLTCAKNFLPWRERAFP